MDPYILQPMNASSAANRMKKGSSNKFSRRILKRVFKRSKLSTHAEVNEDNSGFDILCAGEGPRHSDLLMDAVPNPIIYPLMGGEKLKPRADVYVPAVKSGRRKSSASDYLQSVNGDRQLLEQDENDNTIDTVRLDQFPRAPNTFAPRDAHINDALAQLAGLRISPDERPRIPGMEKRMGIIKREGAEESATKDYTRHRRMKTRNSGLIRQQSRSRRISIEPSPEREDPVLLHFQAGRDRLAKELPKPVIDLSSLKSRSQVIDAAIPNHHRTYRVEWETYLKDYCAGRFNIISPPNPPRRHTTFTYLPALSPHNEEERMAALDRLNPQWSSSQNRQGMMMINTAQKEFNASGAAISLVVSNVEILKVQEGYGREIIKRSDSIAAHALLSTEVLVVLDTYKDWRFAGNPLVAQDPRIRFFAGAPMMTCSGAVIGVFAIFSSEPRAEFTAMQRRRLTDYSAVAMTDIMPRSKNLSPQSLRPVTPTPHGQPTPQASFDMDDMAIHPAFRKQVVETCDFDATPKRTLETPEFASQIRSWNANVPTPGRPTPDPELTPPTSSPEEEKFPRQPSPGFGKNHKNLFLAMHHPNLTYRERESGGAGVGIPVLRSWTPRPFSGSDLTSVEGRPHPNTPLDAVFDNAAKKSMDDESLFARSVVDQSFIYEQEKARMIVEHTASLDAEAFYRADWPETPTQPGFIRESSRPLLEYFEPPEERGLAYR